MYQRHPSYVLPTSPVLTGDVRCLSHDPQEARLSDGAGTSRRRHAHVIMTTQGHLWPEHPVVPRLSRGHTADVSASSEWRHNRDVPAMSLGRPPDARETSRPRPSGVTAGDVPETSSAGGHRLSDGCGTSPRRPSPADAPGTSPTVQRRPVQCIYDKGSLQCSAVLRSKDCQRRHSSGMFKDA